MQHEEINEKGRRDFLKNLAIATVATAACGSLNCSCSAKKPVADKKVKLLSPEGEIVETIVAGESLYQRP